MMHIHVAARASRAVRRSALRPLLCFALVAWLAPIAAAPAGAAFEADFECPVFAEAPELYAKDHSLVRHADGTYHLFYSVGRAGQGWNLPGNEIDLGHATSADLVHWTIQPRVLAIDPEHGWKGRNLWAPHVVRADLVIGGAPWAYLMSYTGVDSSRNQQIGIAVSNDLFAWTDLSVTQGAFRPDPGWAQWDPALVWQNCRDSYVLRDGDGLKLIASATTRPGYLGLGTRGAIALAASSDGLTWTDRGSPLVVNDHWTLMASGHLVKNPVSGLWHLLYTRTVEPGGIHLLTSSALESGWDVATGTPFDPSAIASEFALTADATLYSRAVDFLDQTGLASRAVRLDPVAWSAGGPSFTSTNPFWAEWTLVSGQLGALPTFRDRPRARSGSGSHVEGLFWVNTAENDAGPFGGCAACDPDESLTGTLRSRPFTLRGTRIRLWVGGTASSLVRVALVDSASGEVLRSASGLGTDAMSEREWETATLHGRRVVIEIADEDPNGHLSVDRIVESGQVVGLHPAPPAALVSGLEIGPNPARGLTTLRYELARDAALALTVYGAGGRLVRRFDLGLLPAGRHAIAWDGRLEGGEAAPAGVYFLRLAPAGLETAGGDEPGASLATRLTLLR
jgi:hypothetical protein